MISILWLRRDLRVHDNPALIAAREGANYLVPAVCLDPRLLHGRHSSEPRTQYLLESLADLDDSLRRRGSRLVIRWGVPEDELPALVREVGGDSVHFTADVGPFARARDRRAARELEALGVSAHEHPGLFAVDDLSSLKTAAGSPYEVFSAFHKAWKAAPRRELARSPRALPPLPRGLDPGKLPSLAELGFSQELADPLPGGERAGRAGRARMHRFLGGAVMRYDESRNMVDPGVSSRLSPYLHFGCVSPREVEHRAGNGPGATAFARQLCWRDFYAHVLLHHPANARAEHQSRYRGRLRYSHANPWFEAWCEGRTGYPLVDAGMRQLAREGWMHNRARLVVGSS